MPGLNNIFILTRATFVEGIRHRTLWVVVVLAALLSLVNLAVTRLFTFDLGKVSVEFGLSSVAFTGLLLVFFLGLKMMGDDLEHQRVSLLLTRPVSVGQYLVGKFFGMGLLLLISTILIGLCATLSMKFVLAHYARFVSPDFSWLTYAMALGCQLMSLLVVLALSILCFSFASGPFVALVLAFSGYLVGQNIELLRRIVQENPHAGLLVGQEKLVVAISWLFPNLSYFDKKSVAAYGYPFSGQEFLLILLYGFSCCAVLLTFSVLLFKRKELG